MHEEGLLPAHALSKSCSGLEANAFYHSRERISRWHREAFRLFWRRKSKAHSHKPKVAAETIGLIREMATENRLWDAERMRGELLKLVYWLLGISVPIHVR
jgi:NTP pyrophosphatase (non-canonical NTP hydrolase)